MSKYDDGMQILNERFGNNKDNVISLATISLEQGENGLPHPCVRDVDAFYEDGEFYIVTYAQSSKMKQISANRTSLLRSITRIFSAVASESTEAGSWRRTMRNSEVN
jgi:hypothetical protein